jgi:hypothetical protein
MTRVATPPTSPVTKSVTTQVTVPREKIAKRAYEKWVKRGYTHGNDQQDWLEAEAELRAEVTPTTTSSSTPAATPSRRR